MIINCGIQSISHRQPGLVKRTYNQLEPRDLGAIYFGIVFNECHYCRKNIVFAKVTEHILTAIMATNKNASATTKSDTELDSLYKNYDILVNAKEKIAEVMGCYSQYFIRSVLQKTRAK